MSREICAAVAAMIAFGLFEEKTEMDRDVLQCPEHTALAREATLWWSEM